MHAEAEQVMILILFIIMLYRSYAFILLCYKINPRPQPGLKAPNSTGLGFLVQRAPDWSWVLELTVPMASALQTLNPRFASLHGLGFRV